jgi:hypothetical protein
MIAIEKEREVQNLETSRKSTMNDGWKLIFYII